MRLLVCGDRNWDDWEFIFDTLELFPASIELIIEGEAHGADVIARQWAISAMIPYDPYPAHWRHTEKCEPDCKRVIGKPAGPIRNQQMIDDGKPDAVIAFHDDIGNSRGTKDMVTRARKAGIPTAVFHH